MPNKQAQKHILAFAVAVLIMLVAWHKTTLHFFNIIWTVDTFSHSLLIPFVSIWLVWNRKNALGKLEPIFWLPGGLLFLLVSIIWLLSQILEIYLVGHISIVAGVQALALLCFGPVLYRNLLFPFLFLFLMVPFGEQLIPPLQDITASMAVSMLDVLGVDYEADGLLITLSSGIYEVARACAGIKFLFTCLVTGILLANLCYKGWKGRITIVLVAVILPVFANALRVLGILLISEATDQEFAKGVDHIIYGWVFLSIILVVLISLAYRFSTLDGDDFIPAKNVFFAYKPYGYWVTVCALFAGIALLFTPIEASRFEPVEPFTAPECKGCAVRKLPKGIEAYEPVFRGVDYKQSSAYRILADNIYSFSGMYCSMRKNHRLRAYRGVSGGKDWTVTPGTIDLLVNEQVPVTEEIYRYGNRRRLVWTSFYTGSAFHSTSTAVKLATAKERLLYGQSAVGIVVFSTEIVDSREEARAVLSKFVSQLSPASFLWDELKYTAEGPNKCVA